MQSFSVDTTEMREFKRKLDKISKSAFPVSVRKTLNETAYQMRTKTLPQGFKDEFITRRPNFIKHVSGFTKCQNTFNVNSMVSEAGILEGKSLAGDRLELQERGGMINNRTVPFADRSGNSPTRKGESAENVQSPIYYARNFKDMKYGVISKNSERVIMKIGQRNNNGKLSKTEFEKHSYEAIVMILKGGKWKTLYLENRSVKLKKRKFVEPAGEVAAFKMPQTFIKEFNNYMQKIK